VISQLAAFLTVSAVVIATPGPDTALTIRNSLLDGRRGGVLTALGVATGQATWAVCTAAGVAGLLRASQPAFVAIRVAGIAYLVLLGLQALVAPLRRVPGVPVARRRGGSTAYRQGLLSNLSNPKMVVFFLSLLPQFGPHGSFTALFALGLVFCSLTLAWLAGYAFVVAKAGDVLRRGRVRRALDAITGLALVAFGLRLAAERH
jgi:threonine/homoserine/homoserine lactone efflux protein